jgi:hypothetical protein
MAFTYTLDYVKLFLHRNGVAGFDNIKETERKVRSDGRITDILTELQDGPCLEIKTHKDKIFRDMHEMIRDKQISGGYIPDSIYLSAKERDLEHKKVPSEYLNAIVQRIQRRVKGSS